MTNEISYNIKVSGLKKKWYIKKKIKAHKAREYPYQLYILCIHPIYTSCIYIPYTHSICTSHIYTLYTHSTLTSSIHIPYIYLMYTSHMYILYIHPILTFCIFILYIHHVYTSHMSLISRIYKGFQKLKIQENKWSIKKWAGYAQRVL